MIVEYIAQQDMTPFPGGSEERPVFAPDSTVIEVKLNPATGVGTASNFLRNGQGFRYFAPNDSVRVLSLGIIFPYAYSISSSLICAFPLWQDDLGAAGYVGEFTGDFVNPTRVKLPYDGAEFPVDVTVVHKSSGRRSAFSMIVDTHAPFDCYVSMINAPTKLDFATTGKNLHAWFFWKVVHTLPMVAG